MKKLLWITAVIMILCTAIFFTGCGKEETNTATSSTEATGLTVETTTEKGFEIESTVTPAEPIDETAKTEAEAEETTEAGKTTQSTTASKSNKVTNSTKATTATTKPNTEDLISRGDAQRIALDHAGVTERQATPTKVELDIEDGKYVYEIDFLAGNMEYEYDINAKTGAIISADKELIND